MRALVSSRNSANKLISRGKTWGHLRFGAPLYIPKPFDKKVLKWSHEKYRYEFGKAFRFDLRDGNETTPLFVYVDSDRARIDEDLGNIESIYFFDKSMNLIGYSNEVFKSSGGGYSFDPAWLKGNEAPLNCY